MFASDNETVGAPVPAPGVQLTRVWSADIVRMPSFFLYEARPDGIEAMALEVSRGKDALT